MSETKGEKNTAPQQNTGKPGSKNPGGNRPPRNRPPRNKSKNRSRNRRSRGGKKSQKRSSVPKKTPIEVIRKHLASVEYPEPDTSQEFEKFQKFTDISTGPLFLDDDGVYEQESSLVYYCKECEECVDVEEKQVGNKTKYTCKSCPSTNIALGTKRSIENYYSRKKKQ